MLQSQARRRKRKEKTNSICLRKYWTGVFLPQWSWFSWRSTTRSDQNQIRLSSLPCKTDKAWEIGRRLKPIAKRPCSNLRSGKDMEVQLPIPDLALTKRSRCIKSYSVSCPPSEMTNFVCSCISCQLLAETFKAFSFSRRSAIQRQQWRANAKHLHMWNKIKTFVLPVSPSIWRRNIPVPHRHWHTH